MPGSRELRALCNALKVTPNKLLFGTEAPAFGEDGAAGIEALLRSDPERQAIMRTRLALLSQKLTDDEAAALLLLVQSLVVARHGAEKARQTLLGADVLAGMARGMMKESATVIREGAQTVEPQRVAADLEDFLKRQGHAPKTDK